MSSNSTSYNSPLAQVQNLLHLFSMMGNSPLGVVQEDTEAITAASANTHLEEVGQDAQDQHKEQAQEAQQNEKSVNRQSPADHVQSVNDGATNHIPPLLENVPQNAPTVA